MKHQRTVAAAASVAGAALIAGLVLAATRHPGSGTSGAQNSTSPALGSPSGGDPLRVSANRLVNGAGSSIQLRGVNRSGTEDACVQGRGPFDGPSDDASISAIAGWRANTVRVPLNEDCWLGINGEPSAGYTAEQYRRAIVS